MLIGSFDQLLHAARAQGTPQRLLLVFAGAELDGDATPEQRTAFEAGHGGALVPLMCVDKAPEEIADFMALREESRAAGPDWAILFAAALSSTVRSANVDVFDGQMITDHLNRMVEAIRRGALDNLLAFDADGHAVELG